MLKPQNLDSFIQTIMSITAHMVLMGLVENFDYYLSPERSNSQREPKNSTQQREKGGKGERAVDAAGKFDMVYLVSDKLPLYFNHS